MSPPSSGSLFTAYRPAGERARVITKLFEDRAGTVWVGTWGGGLHRLEQAGGEVKFHLVEIGLTKGANLRTILEDRQGRLWIGAASDGNGGLYRRFPDGRAEHYDMRHGLLSADVLALLEDRAGRIWIGTKNGLHRL